MANFILNYLIRSAWEGKRATDQAGRDLESLGKKGDQAAKGTDKASGALSNFDSKISGLVTGGALIAAGYMIADFASEAIDAASDVEEAYGKYDVVFGQFADSTEAALTQIADVTKRSKYDLIEYAATLQDTFVPLGFARGEAAAMSEQLVQLSIDLASFNNVAEADVVRDLQSALVGNTETLRKYGVIANDASIKQEALELGLWDGVGAIDAQTKAQSILSLTLKGTTDAQGDAERTSGSLANVSRDLDSALTDLSVTIGTKLVPAATETKRGLAGVVRELTAGLEVQEMMDAALREGRISQGEYNDMWKELTTNIYGASAVVEMLTEKERARAALTEYQSEKWREAGEPQWEYYRSLYAIANETERMEGIAYQNGRTSMQNADLVRVHTERIDEQTAATKALALEQEKAHAIERANYWSGVSGGLYAQYMSENDILKWTTSNTYTGGRTSTQDANLNELQSEYDKTAEKIRSLEGGTAGLGMEQDKLNETLTEEYERLALVGSAMEPLTAIQKELVSSTSGWVVNVDEMNDLMFDAANAAGLGASALSEYATSMGMVEGPADEAALKIVALELAIGRATEAYKEGEITQRRWFELAGNARREVTGEDRNSGTSLLNEDKLARDEALFEESATEITNILDAIGESETIATIGADTDPFRGGYDEVQAWMADLAKGVTVPIRSRDDTGGGTGGGSVGGGSQPPEHSFVGSGSNNLTLVTSGKAATNIAISYWDQQSRLTQAAGHSRR